MIGTGTLDITIQRGASFQTVVTWGIPTVDDPVDLTGCDIDLMIKVNKGDEEPIIHLEKVGEEVPDEGLVDGIYIEPLSGIILIYITRSSTKEMDFDTAYYDLLIRGADVFYGDSDEGIRLLEGKVTLSKEVTDV